MAAIAEKNTQSNIMMKVPPHSEEAEISILGALLINKDAIYDVAELLLPEHFYNPSHGQIFAAILDLYEDRIPIDIVTVSERLKKNKA
jgi:replicative DNA helicase